MSQNVTAGGSRKQIAVAPIEELESRRLLASALTDAGVTTAAVTTPPPRIMENLGRGVVAVRSSSTQVLVTWRLLALDPATIAFNVYRSANGAAAVKLNASPITTSTNYLDIPPSLTVPNAYYVRPVINGVEQTASTAFTLKANNATEPVVRIPITPPPEGYRSKSIWVGDLDGDGEFDYVLDRLAPFYVDPVTGVENNDIGTGNQYLEAFKSDGTRLWTIDMGLTSRGTYNISPGAATLSMGMWDGATVQDLNGDGKAEVVLKIANGVKFPDGTTFTTTNDQRQFIAVLNGITGNKLAQLEFPTDHSSAGRLSTMLGVGYLGSSKPSIFAWLRNRNANKSFNDIMIAWDWNGGTTISQRWKLLMTAGSANASGASGFHQMRIIDLNGDGYDEMLPGSYAINGKTGTILYKLPGIGHGDRFHVGDFDPDRPGYEGYGIQQNDGKIGTEGAILDYYYDATNGQVLWTNNGVGYDVGRGAAGDIDPSRRGYEVWSFEGIHNGPTHELIDDDSTDGVPWPNLRIWWDGDVGSEELDTTVINKYYPTTKTTGRLVTGYRLGATTNEKFPGIYGDIMGDWREEAVFMNSTWSEILILTTNVQTSTRLYTLAQNPPYRNSLTLKGYYQSNHVDYYLGTGMTAPPTPNIVYADQVPPTLTGGVFNYTANQSNAVTFSENVSASVSNVANFSVVNRTTGFTVPSAEVGVSYNLGTNTTSITYSSLLADGNYRITFSGITDVIGNPLVGINYVDFFVLAGDANRDRVVDSADQTILTANLNQSGKTFAQGNFDYAGTVSAADQAILSDAMFKWLPDIGPLTVPATGNPDTITLKRESASLVNLYQNGSSTPKYRIYVGGLSGFSFAGANGDDKLTLDYANGTPFTGSTFTFNGGAGADTVAILGSTTADSASFSGATLNVGATVISVIGNEAYSFDGRGGLDSLTVLPGPVVELPTPQVLNTLNLTGTLSVKNAANALLRLKLLSITGNGFLDLNDNDLVLDYTGGSNVYTSILNWVRAGLVVVGATGKGIGSGRVTAASNTRLAVIDNASSSANFTNISGYTPPTTSVLVKYTGLGDFNIDGIVDGTDYALLDSGFSTSGASGWWRGDLDYNNLIDGNDYALLDTGFAAQ